MEEEKVRPKEVLSDQKTNEEMLLAEEKPEEPKNIQTNLLLNVASPKNKSIINKQISS